MHRPNYTDTGSKNISVREDVYRALKREKRDDESFSDLIERLTRGEGNRHPLFCLVGTLDEGEADRVRDAAAFRSRLDDEMDPDA